MNSSVCAEKDLLSNGDIIFKTCDGDWFDVVVYVKLTVFECSKYSSGDSRNISPEPREIYIEANFLRLSLSCDVREENKT